MTRQVLFVQGAGENTHDQWDNKLVDNLRDLLGSGYEVRYPRMPDEAEPAYAAWEARLRSEFATLNDGAIVVGHSVGGTILINALAAASPAVSLGGIFLLATPFAGKGGWPADGFDPPDDLGTALPARVPVYLYHGTKDETAPPDHLKLYAAAIPQAVVRLLAGRDHQLGDDLGIVAEDIQALS